jgi:hypothetical protein
MRTKLPILVFLVILMVSLLSATAVPTAAAVWAPQAPATGPTLAGQAGGVTTTVGFSEGQLYFNVGPRIARMAASKLHAPALPAAYSEILPGIPEDIKVANGYVYVALGSDGVAIVSATTLKLASIQELPGDDFAYAVAVGSQRLYVAAGSAGIVAYDLGPGKNTLTYSQTRAFSSPEREIVDVEVNSDTSTETLFAAGNPGGIVSFDLSSSPVLGASFTASADHEINAITLSDSHVYAAADDEFVIFDAGDLSLTGEIDLVPGAPSWVHVSNLLGGVIFASNEAGGIDVLDVSSPASPFELGSNSFSPASLAVNLYAAQTGGTIYLYVADLDAGLSIASAPSGTPANLSLPSPGYVNPGPAVTRAVAAVSHQAFVFSEPSTLWTVDSANPATLKTIGDGLKTDTSINSMAVYSNWLVASAGTSGLLRYQINPGGELTSQGSLDTDGVAYAADISWPNAVLADGENGLLVVNIDGTMSLAGSAPAPDPDSDFRIVDVQGTFAYVVDNNGAFRIYDLTVPAAPAARGTLLQEGVLDVKVSGDLAFLACGEAGVKVVDIKNPDSPAFVSGAGYDTPGLALNLAVHNHYLFVADLDAGVHMFDVQTNGYMDLISTLDTSGAASQLSLVPDGYLYVADDYGSLAVVQSPLITRSKIFIPVIADSMRP